MTLRPLFGGAGELAPLIDDGYAVLTPNRRLSRAVRDADNRRRAAGPQGAWPSATIMPLRQFWTEQWRRAVTRELLPARPVLDALRQRLLWQRIIEEDREAGFSLLSSARAAQLCQSAWEQLDLWQVDPGAARWRSWFGLDEDSRSFLRWAARFEAALADLGALTPERAQRELVEHLAGRGREALEIAPLVLLHTDVLPPLHAALAGLSPRVHTIEQPPARGHVAPVLAFAHAESELEAAARWCRERAEADPAGRHAVVLQDMQGTRAHFETLLRREFGCLTGDYDSLPVNFATGFTLDRVPLVRDALRILSLYLQVVSIEDAIAVLDSRFLPALPLRRDRLEAQRRELRALSVERVPARVLRGLLAPLLEADAAAPPWEAGLALASRGQPLERSRLPGEWLDVFRSLLLAWRWGEGAALDSLEFQQREAWEDALDAYAMLDAVSGRLDFAAALAQLRGVLAERQFQPKTSDRAVQVLGPLETTGLAFDGLWLSGMSAAAWPARARPNPYLPITLQRQLRMPGADAAWEWERAQHRWRHWQACANTLQVSFLRVEDESEQLPSALLAGLPITHVDAAPAVDRRWLALRPDASSPLETVAMDDVPLAPDEAAAEGVSSALLEAQAACPFQAFAQGRLRVEAPTATSAGLLPSERGTLLHRALYQLFGEFPDRDTLRGALPALRREAIERALDTAGNGLDRNRRAVVGAAALQLEQQRIAGLLETWLGREAARDEAFRVIEREGARELQLAGLVLRLRVDRVDRLADGSALIIDYKSGRAESLERWFEDPPARPQLPLYALLEPAADGISYAVLRRDDSGWRGIAARPCLDGVDAADRWLPDSTDAGGRDAMAVLRERWAQSLARLAADVVAGVSAVAPARDACRRCGRESLCRIDEAGR